jgi:hypothetical protein
MSDEMKLLLAMCDAMDLTVEAVLDYKDRKATPEEFNLHQQSIPLMMVPPTWVYVTDGEGAYDRDEDGNYTARLYHPEQGFKVTKRTNKTGPR